MCLLFVTYILFFPVFLFQSCCKIWNFKLYWTERVCNKHLHFLPLFSSFWNLLSERFNILFLYLFLWHLSHNVCRITRIKITLIAVYRVHSQFFLSLFFLLWHQGKSERIIFLVWCMEEDYYHTSLYDHF